MSYLDATRNPTIGQPVGESSANKKLKVAISYEALVSAGIRGISADAGDSGRWLGFGGEHAFRTPRGCDRPPSHNKHTVCLWCGRSILGARCFDRGISRLLPQAFEPENDFQ